jgi:hypothetical protein
VLLAAGPILRHNPDEIGRVVGAQLQQRSPQRRDGRLILREFTSRN